MYRTPKEIPILKASDQLSILITNINPNLISLPVLPPITPSTCQQLKYNHPFLLLQSILPSITTAPSSDQSLAQVEKCLPHSPCKQNETVKLIASKHLKIKLNEEE